uniref:Uncharacterized protein n=1 Tax=Coccidioides posadasii RMSCC 3488 TaxID=454284 RepID=A0A0J6FPD6_COCPO|nr:hypothetical protein CPAG_07155 [Coccidioides posadasii RMSCC 3488]
MYGPPNAERKIYYYRIRKTGWREKRKVKKKKKATISEREACFLRVKRSRREGKRPAPERECPAEPRDKPTMPTKVPRRRALGKPPLNSWVKGILRRCLFSPRRARPLPSCDALRVFGKRNCSVDARAGRKRRRWRETRTRSLLAGLYDNTP